MRENFKSLPRYLKAVQYRLDKYDNNTQKVQELRRYVILYWQAVEKQAKKVGLSLIAHFSMAINKSIQV